MILIYKMLWRSTESGNWQVGETRNREVTMEQFEDIKSSCEMIGATYSEKFNEFFMVHADKLHATKIIVKAE